MPTAASQPLPPASADPDRPLVEQALAGDYAAFEGLVSRYEKRVYALALRILRNDADAQDAVQATMLTLVEKLETFQGTALFATWLLRIATNEALQILRKRKRTQERVRSLDANEDSDAGPLPHPDFIAKWRNDPHALAQDAEVRELVTAALDELEEKYRMVFLLRDVQGLSTEETAQALGISTNNAKVRLLRARLMLRERLTRLLGDPSTELKHSHPH